MLTLKERQKILSFFRFAAIINLFPVRVDLENWEIRSGCRTKQMTWACRVSFSLFIAHSVYTGLSFVHAFSSARHTPLHQMIIHAECAAACVNYILWYYILYVKHSDVNYRLTKLTLTGSITGGTHRQTLLITV